MSYQEPDLLDDPDFDLEALQEVVSTLTGKPFDPENLTGHLLVAYRRLAVRSIRSPYPPQTDMYEAFEEMRVSAPLLRMARMPQPAVRILAPSYSGKSVGARDYVARIKEKLGKTSTSAVYAKIDSDGSVGSIAADILRACGEPRPESLSPEKRWQRARRCLKARGVDLLILDEFQRAGRRVTIHPIIAAKILDILDDCDCAIAFVGKLKAKEIFKVTEDLGNRLDTPVSIGRLRWITHGDEFIQFADAFDEALVAAGVIKFKVGLARPDIAQLLLESASGLIGQFSRIIETAVINITRAGYDGITRQDLSDAVQDWAIGNQRIGYNPFEGKASKPRNRNTKEAAEDEEGQDDSDSDDNDDDDEVEGNGEHVDEEAANG